MQALRDAKGQKQDLEDVSTAEKQKQSRKKLTGEVARLTAVKNARGLANLRQKDVDRALNQSPVGGGEQASSCPTSPAEPRASGAADGEEEAGEPVAGVVPTGARRKRATTQDVLAGLEQQM